MICEREGKVVRGHESSKLEGSRFKQYSESGIQLRHEGEGVEWGPETSDQFLSVDTKRRVFR